MDCLHKSKVFVTQGVLYLLDGIYDSQVLGNYHCQFRKVQC
jgi:hypothetical protein